MCALQLVGGMHVFEKGVVTKAVAHHRTKQKFCSTVSLVRQKCTRLASQDVVKVRDGSKAGKQNMRLSLRHGMTVLSDSKKSLPQYQWQHQA